MLLSSYSDTRGAFPKDAALVADEFGSALWCLLYQRLGDGVFAHLLQRCSMFRMLSGFNFLQLSGPIVASKHVRIDPKAFPFANSKMAERLNETRLKAEAKLKSHETRLDGWKKRNREKEKDEEIKSIDEAPPPRKQSCPYPITYVSFQRHDMYYRHPKKICFGLPVGWKGLQWAADEKGAKALASWIFNCSEDSLPLRAASSLYLFRGILKRLKKLHLKPILDATCPLVQTPESSLNENSTSTKPEEQLNTSFREPLATQAALTLPQQDPSSSFAPRVSQILSSDFPHMTSSGVPNSKSKAPLAPQPRPERMDEDLVLTQDNATSTSVESVPSSDTDPRFFSYKNDEDYLLYLLIEPAENPVSRMTLPQLLPMFCRHHQVSRFVYRSLRGLIPAVGFGCEENWKLLEAKISAFVSLNRFDTISSCTLLEGFQITKIPWISSKPENKGPFSAEELSLRTKIFHAFLVWIFDEVVMPLLGTTFYITETMMHRNQMFFYRREVWSRITVLGFESLISRGIFRAVPLEDAKEALKKRELGACNIRFLPKKNGVRPIVNMKKNNSNPERHEPRSINSFLKPILSILTYEAYSSPKDLLASSLLTNDEVHRKLLSFKRRLLQLPPDAELPMEHLPKLPKLYFVKTDIISAFDEVNQAMLMKILEEDVVAAERYLAILVAKTKIERERARSTTLKSITSNHPEQPKTMTEILEEQSRKQTNSVLSKNMRMGFMDRSALLAILREHIVRHIIRFDGKYYVQSDGIPQGSTLSSLLCSLYFAHLEKTELSKFVQVRTEPAEGKPQASVLLRWIDDFLFISTDRDEAVSFFERMHEGFPAYGTRCNPSKSQVNFNLKFGETDISNVSTQPHTQYNADGSEGPSTSGINELIWCGWLINTKTLEFRRSVPDGVLASQLITNNISSRPGYSISQKLHASLRNAVYPLLFDPRFNARPALLENTFDVACWSAVRLVALERGSQFPKSGAPKGPRKLTNPTFIVNLILSLIQHLATTLAKKTNSHKRLDLKYPLRLSLNDITMMSLHAYRMMLKRHLPLFQPVVDILQAVTAQHTTQSPKEALQEYHKAAAHRFPKFAGAVFA